VLIRIRNQLTETSIIDKCDFVIDNTTYSELERKVLQIHDVIISLN